MDNFKFKFRSTDWKDLIWTSFCLQTANIFTCAQQMRSDKGIRDIAYEYFLGTLCFEVTYGILESIWSPNSNFKFSWWILKFCFFKFFFLMFAPHCHRFSLRSARSWFGFICTGWYFFLFRFFLFLSTLIIFIIKIIFEKIVPIRWTETMICFRIWISEISIRFLWLRPVSF